ncbi:uncharacterized protein LOC133345328 [Lethenteron reissneri]|uniref:uncharacterized protein LOC133345328 n=1 Tax=Lethenteron reissneri TaxID=7753 RepID=UPI002AB725F8|nr:uncharacterized protein LOC133345328 [Lethenteron reissneri]
MERNSGVNFGFSEYHPWSSVTDEPNATNARPSPSDSEQMSFSGFDIAQESPDMFGMVSNLVNDYEEPSLDTSTSRITPTYDLTMLWNALNIRDAVDPLGRKVCDNLMTPEKTSEKKLNNLGVRFQSNFPLSLRNEGIIFTNQIMEPSRDSSLFQSRIVESPVNNFHANNGKFDTYSHSTNNSGSWEQRLDTNDINYSRVHAAMGLRPQTKFEKNIKSSFSCVENDTSLSSYRIPNTVNSPIGTRVSDTLPISNSSHNLELKKEHQQQLLDLESRTLLGEQIPFVATNGLFYGHCTNGPALENVMNEPNIDWSNKRDEHSSPFIRSQHHDLGGIKRKLNASPEYFQTSNWNRNSYTSEPNSQQIPHYQSDTSNLQDFNSQPTSSSYLYSSLELKQRNSSQYVSCTSEPNSQQIPHHSDTSNLQDFNSQPTSSSYLHPSLELKQRNSSENISPIRRNSLPLGSFLPEQNPFCQHDTYEKIRAKQAHSLQVQNACWMLQQSFDRPSNELCISIEKCLMNAKALTSEMNMVETKLLKNYSGLYVSSVESSSPVHWLDANHTHINNLIFYQLKENLRLKILFGKMESLCGVSVPDSIMLDLANHLKAVRLVKLWRQEASDICGEGGQTLVGSVMQLFMSIRKLRTSLWCVLQFTLL